MRVVFMGTASFAVATLDALLAAGHEIAGVVTQPDRPSGRGRRIHHSPVKARAREAAFPILQPESLSDDAARDAITALGPDLVVVVAYGQIIPRWLRELPRFGVLNVHGSILPRHRGAAPVHWAIIRGDRETGVSIMAIDAGLDTGPVYATSATVVGPDESAVELSERLATMGAALLVDTVDALARGGAQATPQDPSLATMAPRLTRRDGYIRWSESAEEIHNRVRGLAPWPAVTVGFRGASCKLLATRRARERFRAPAGGMVMDGDRLIVTCGDGAALEIVTIQPESRRPVSGIEFARGSRITSPEAFMAVEYGS
jgi:methionyl-tRNA formyltransferase